ncbi:MAG: ATP-binding protein [Cyclobacteriaceae bacterium]
MTQFLFPLIGLCLLSVSVAFSQPKDAAFWRMYSDDGLSSDAITVSIRDHEGYVWIGTRDGLNKLKSYYEFDVYHSNRKDTTALTHDHIRSMHVDKSGALWIGTSSGLNVYNRELNNFTRIAIDADGEMLSSVYSIYEDENVLYLGTDKSLMQMDLAERKITGKWVVGNIKGESLAANSITKHDGKIFVGTEDGLYCIINGTIQKVNGLGILPVLSLESVNEDLFIGTADSGVLRFRVGEGIADKLDMSTSPSITSNRINTMKRLANGDLWIGTDNGLNVYQYKGDLLQYTHDFDNVFGISDPVIRDIYEDEDGSLWIATALNGIMHYHAADNQFRYVGKRTSEGGSTELMDYNVLSMYANKSKHQLWLGSRNGLSMYDELADRFTHYPFAVAKQKSDNQILSITSINNRIYYLGTQKGLIVWDDLQKRYLPGPVEDRVNKVFVDSQNTLWIGTEDSGLKSVRLDADGQISRMVRDWSADGSSRIKEISDIVELPEGQIWIGTSKGLFKMQNQHILSFDIELDTRIISDIGVNFLDVSKTKTLIVGTRQEGALEIMESEEAFVRLSTASGLMSNDVRSHIRGPDNSEWVATNSGLASLQIRDSLPYIERCYYVGDGLQSNQFNPNVAAAMDNIYIGGPSGLTIFDPADMTSFSMDLKLVIQGLLLDGQRVTPLDHPEILKKTISTTDRLVLPSSTKNFTLEFQALDYLRPDSIVYALQLSPYDNDWIIQDDKNFITYNSLQRGQLFTFEVKAKSRYRNWSEIRQIEVYIEPYFYDTSWFKACVIMALALLLIAIERYRTRSSRIREQELGQLVENKTRALSMEVNEKKNALVALEKAKTEAEQATRAKSQFLAKMSHEIRTPLNGILGISNILYDDEPKSTHVELISILKRTSLSLKNLIDDLLDLSKIEAEKVEIQSELLDIRELMKQVYEEVAIQAGQKSLDLKLTLDEKTPSFVLGDIQRLKQVLLNLTFNALKFTEEGTIELKTRIMSQSDQHAEVQFEVEDTGIGIHQNDLERIFSNFVQIEGYSQKKYGGTGLGLAISERLIKLMGGRIWAESELGKGSCFKFLVRLTLAEPEKLDDPIKVEDTLLVGHSGKILVVEDNDVNILVVTKLLEQLGHDADVAKNGQIALAQLDRENYDLILMDVQMPVMNGYEATLAIRNSTLKYKDVPIIALSAGALLEEREKCREVGMNDFLSKPILPRDLKEMISRYLEVHSIN